MARDDDILLGTEILVDRDSDGDGVGDMQERLDGTDPTDASDRLRPEPTRSDDDPRAALNPETLEREISFDPTAGIPEGMTVDVGLAGLTDLAGDALKTGPDHGGVGEFDAALDGRVGGTSPLDMLRDPTIATTSPSGSTPNEPPPGTGQSGSSDPGDNPDLVAGIDDVAYRAAKRLGAAAKDIIETPGAIIDGLKDGFSPPKSIPVAEDDPTYPKAPPPPDPPKTTSTDPDAVGGGGATVEEIERAITLSGSETKPVEGSGAGPQILGGPPETRPGDLVTDPGDGQEIVDVATTAPRVTTAGPDVINPDSGVVPLTGGVGPSQGDGTEGGGSGTGGGGGEDWLTGVSSAATASSSAPDVTDISVVGAGGGGGIQNVDTGAAAVDTFATQFLADTPAPALLADPLTPSLAADLGADPLASVDPVPITIPDIGHTDVPDLEPATDLFGNDDAIGG